MQLQDCLQTYDFSHSGTMTGVLQSVALGNGTMGVNIWADDTGVLYLLLSGTDNWSEHSRLLKTGLVTVRFDPNPFDEQTRFTFSLYDAFLTIRGRGLELRVYVDANAPCCRLLAAADQPVAATVRIVNIRSEQRYFPEPDWNNVVLSGLSAQLPESADVVFTGEGCILGQYHHNQASGYADTLRNQHLAHYIGREKDPLLNRIFGFATCSEQLCLEADSLATKEPVRDFELTVCALTQTDSNPVRWKTAAIDLVCRCGTESSASWLAHRQVWNDFWEKSFILVSGSREAEQVTRGYLYQRYFHRAGGRGPFPILFTGSIFTIHPDESGHYDNRNWGGAYWIQNTRLIYWSLLYSGDFDLMQPFFKLIMDMVPISRERVRTYYKHRGIHIPETVTFFGTYANLCYGYSAEDGTHKGGWQNNIVARLPGDIPNTYIRWHYNGMLEIAWMMLIYRHYAGDAAFAGQIFAYIREVLLFFHEHFEKVDGKLLLSPVSALETWQNCVNDAPDIAGLTVVTQAVMDCEQSPPDLIELCRTIRAELPALPVETINGRLRLAPCAIKVDQRFRNGENAELYAVFPYNLFGVGKPDCDPAVLAFNDRLFPFGPKGAAGWNQDGIQAAVLGLGRKAKEIITLASSMQNPKCLFPGNWGPNFDETPDQDLGSCLMLTLQHMVLISNRDAHHILPAWPREWSVHFRLPLYDGGTVECVCRDGVVTSLHFSDGADSSRVRLHETQAGE